MASVMFVVHLLNVWMSTMGSDRSLQERVLIGWVAPRGSWRIHCRVESGSYGEPGNIEATGDSGAGVVDYCRNRGRGWLDGSSLGHGPRSEVTSARGGCHLGS